MIENHPSDDTVIFSGSDTIGNWKTTFASFPNGGHQPFNYQIHLLGNNATIWMFDMLLHSNLTDKVGILASLKFQNTTSVVFDHQDICKFTTATESVLSWYFPLGMVDWNQNRIFPLSSSWTQNSNTSFTVEIVIPYAPRIQFMITTKMDVVDVFFIDSAKLHSLVYALIAVLSFSLVWLIVWMFYNRRKRRYHTVQVSEPLVVREDPKSS